jgi:sec-independent protein translocase protein TatA
MNSLFEPVAGVFGLGGPELLLIFAVILLLFGAKRLPELAKGLGRSVKEFKKASTEAEEEIRQAAEAEAAKKPEATKTEPKSPVGSN